MSSKQVLRANAKINLTLDVLRKRYDGYHDIQSYVAFLDLGDDLTINRSEKLSVSFDNPFNEDISGEFNSITQTHKYLCSTFPNLYQYNIHVKKNIPIAAGLGGGSCDAASFMRYLISNGEINMNKIDLNSLAREVGADIPCCLYNKSAYITGIGDSVCAVELSDPYYCILVNPLIPISTRKIYEMINIKDPEKLLNKDVLLKPTMTQFINGKNDFEDIISEEYPIIKKIIKSISNFQGCLFARMTGSGPTCFGFFSNKADVLQCESDLKDIYPKFWIRSTKLLN